MTNKTLENNAVLKATGLFVICWVGMCAMAHATEVEIELIALESQELPGTDGDPVRVLKSPGANELGDLVLAGNLWVDGALEGFSWTPPDVVRFRGSSLPAGALVSSPAALSNSGEWLVITFSEGTHEERSGYGVVVEVGDIVQGATASHEIKEIGSPAMTADSTGFFHAKLRNQSDGSHRGGVLRVEDGGEAAVEMYLDPDGEVDGYEIMGVGGITRFGVSLNGVYEVFVADLRVDGVKRNSLIIEGRVVAMKDDPTGRPNEKWRTFEQPSVSAAGSYVGAAIVKNGPSYPKVLAYSPSNALRTFAETARRPSVLLAQGDCAGTMGGPSPCVTLQNNGKPKTAAFDRPDSDGTDAVAHVWVNAMSGPEAGAEYLFYVCDAADPTSSHLLLSRGDPLDLDGDGITEAEVERVGLGAYREIAFGESQLYIGAMLTIGGQELDAVLGLARPECRGLGGEK